MRGSLRQRRSKFQSGLRMSPIFHAKTRRRRKKRKSFVFACDVWFFRIGDEVQTQPRRAQISRGRYRNEMFVDRERLQWQKMVVTRTVRVLASLSLIYFSASVLSVNGSSETNKQAVWWSLKPVV